MEEHARIDSFRIERGLQAFAGNPERAVKHHGRHPIAIARSFRFGIQHDAGDAAQDVYKRQVQQLEAQLGARLLHRTTRQVRLTADGAQLLERLRPLLSEVEDIDHLFQQSQRQVSGRLIVDVPSRIARRLVAPALPGLLRRHPRLQLSLGSSDRAIDLIQEGVALRGAEAVIIGASNIVGKPMAMLLLAAGATITICNSKTRELAAQTRRADVLVLATGKPDMIDGSMIKPGAVVIDVGINRGADGKLCGDVDFASASQVAGAITPVPRGVGPMTIAMLLVNTVEAAERAAA